ncbi:serine hydrolase [Oceanicella sp. SM1341]|uniref:serine hydrolase domain-containing protein n=1 Tax=Oceanicella sp. SM1341 TaxID=1548889 RepID=UPI001300606F|nr:serine hydrolase domain-containing protein [Oceanicella sp. SM1341]
MTALADGLIRALRSPDGALRRGCTGEGLAADSPVPWWSLTKTFIAVLVLRAAEAGRLSLDAPLPGHAATPRQILAHRAGLPDYYGLPAYSAAVAANEEPWTAEEMLARLPPAGPAPAPFAYSNVGYLLLRRHLEAAEGKGLGTLLAELFAPLGLTARLAETRQDMARTAFPGGQAYHPGWVYHGTLIGPVGEAAQALGALFDGRLIGPASLAAMRDGTRVEMAVPPPWVTPAYGLGLMAGTLDAGRGPVLVEGHGGGGPGSTLAAFRFPSGAIAVTSGPVEADVTLRAACALGGAA